jgi:hypothetical protein
VADFRAAAERGLVVSMHQSGGPPAPAWDAVRTAELLGPRINIAHGAGLTDEWFTTLVDEGVSFTITPARCDHHQRVATGSSNGS